MAKTINLQRFATIGELFSQNDVLDYVRDRTYPTLLGDSLFTPRRVETLDLDQVYAGNRVPVIADVAAFNSEAGIGSREASKLTLSLALIKRKMQIDEKDLYAIQNPRNAAEADYLKNRVYDDIDGLVQGVLSRVEKMAMDALATGKVTVLDNDSGRSATFDYQVPKAHQADLTSGSGNVSWDKDNADPINDIINWVDAMDVTPTRVLTSRVVYRAITRNANVLKDVFGTSTRALGQADLDAFMEAQGLPIIRTYDQKYKVQDEKGAYSTARYFPADAFVMMPDDNPGEKLFAPTPEELGLANDPSVNKQSYGNVFATVYTENHDPVGTWEKASAVALPSFPGANEVFQATPIKLSQ